jgi:Fe-S cluster assembly scaffold protein SufB
MSTNNEITVIDEQTLQVNDTIREAITAKHKFVSRIKTPKPFIKKKMGLDYVEFSYMREIADKEYPGWSWTIEKTEVLGSEAFVVQGRLLWYDEGIWRKADMVAAHRIQKKRGTNEFVDIGNDIKASNTDCIKKAFNMYLNIADDVYRNQVEDLQLSDEQKNEILVLASDVSEERMEQVHELIKDQAVNTANFDSSIRKLERELEKQLDAIGETK